MTVVSVVDDVLQQLARAEDRLRRLEQSIIPNARARVSNDADISTVNNTVKLLTFNNDDINKGDLHSTLTNSGRLTASITGDYIVGADIQWAASGTGTRLLRIMASDASCVTRDIRSPEATGNVTEQSITTLMHLNAGEYLYVEAYQTSGGALKINATDSSPMFWMTLCGS